MIQFSQMFIISTKLPETRKKNESHLMVILISFHRDQLLILIGITHTESLINYYKDALKFNYILNIFTDRM